MRKNDIVILICRNIFFSKSRKSLQKCVVHRSNKTVMKDIESDIKYLLWGRKNIRLIRFYFERLVPIIKIIIEYRQKAKYVTIIPINICLTLRIFKVSLYDWEGEKSA